MVGSMQESPTLLILRCRARHNAGKRTLTHARTHTLHTWLRTGLPSNATDGRKPRGARLPPQSLVRLPCGEEIFFLFCFFACLPCPGAVDSRLFV